MQPLYQARDRFEAQFLRDFLDSHLITVAVLGEYLGGAVGELPANIYPTVWVVEDEDLPRARELLARFLHREPVPATGWTCSACGEWVDGVFAVCWNCGHVRG